MPRSRRQRHWRGWGALFHLRLPGFAGRQGSSQRLAGLRWKVQISNGWPGGGAGLPACCCATAMVRMLAGGGILRHFLRQRTG